MYKCIAKYINNYMYCATFKDEEGQIIVLRAKENQEQYIVDEYYKIRIRRKK